MSHSDIEAAGGLAQEGATCPLRTARCNTVRCVCTFARMLVEAQSLQYLKRQVGTDPDGIANEISALPHTWRIMFFV